MINLLQEISSKENKPVLLALSILISASFINASLYLFAINNEPFVFYSCGFTIFIWVISIAMCIISIWQVRRTRNIFVKITVWFFSCLIILLPIILYCFYIYFSIYKEF